MASKSYKICAVPLCQNTTIKTPSKLFIHVPQSQNNRVKWLQLARRDPNSVSPKSSIYFCEDHFDLPMDMENYMEFKIMGSVQIRMKPSCLPSKFECQPDRLKRTAESMPLSVAVKRQRALLIQEILAQTETVAVHTPSTSNIESQHSNIETGDLQVINEKSDLIEKTQNKSTQVCPETESKIIQVNLKMKYRSKGLQTKSFSAHKATSTAVQFSAVATSPIHVKPSSVGHFNMKRKLFTIKEETLVSEQDAQPVPGRILDTRTPLDFGGREPDPLSQVVQQCRFCGDFSKDCVAVSSDKTYQAGNKTTLALNETSVQLDFNDRSLPKTVCRDCDAKLQEFCEFVKVIKAAQGTLINVAEEKEEFESGAELEETTADFEESTAEYEEIEILVVKTEDSDDDKEGTVDPLAVGETVFVNKTHKRKRDTDTAQPKKLKAKEKCDDDLVIGIKEEVVENNTNEQS